MMQGETRKEENMTEERARDDEPGSRRQEAVEEVERIVEAAQKLGVEVDEADAAQWLAAMAGAQGAFGDFSVDARSGVYGHHVTLLDFDPAILARYRRVAEIVEIPDRPGVETALALSGSAAQSKVQLFPGDADFFERVNIQAATQEEACRILGETMRDKALAKRKSQNYELVEVKWGTWQQDVIHRGLEVSAGSPISWSAAEVEAGHFEVLSAKGETMVIDWSYGEQAPGWCKLDWVIVEPEEGRVLHASNMLDATWETPEGDIVPLDGYLDPYFQEVYLDAESIPLFTKVVRHLSVNALREYVAALHKEVAKYSHGDPRNYGKVAKRLYNIFRLTGRWQEAAFLRELFDEPAALLYQVASLIDTLEEALTCGASLDRDALIDQVDDLIRAVVRTSEGPTEEKIVDALLQLRDDVAGRRRLGDERETVLAESQRQVGDLVNHYFRERLFLMPEIAEYVESLSWPY